MVPLQVLVLNILKFGGVLVSVWNLKLSFYAPLIGAAEAIIKDSVEPLLEEYRPPGITSLKFSQLSLGTVAPKIEGKMTLEIIHYLLSTQSPDAKFRNEAESTPELQEETMLVGGLLSILQLSMGKATFGDASNCRDKPDKASVFMLQADCWKITLLGDEFRSRNMGP
ncbi:hypothetical protein OROMI_026306 [Orobanche minor]